MDIRERWIWLLKSVLNPDLAQSYTHEYDSDFHTLESQLVRVRGKGTSQSLAGSRFHLGDKDVVVERPGVRYRKITVRWEDIQEITVKFRKPPTEALVNRAGR